jgi:hypothetical protein
MQRTCDARIVKKLTEDALHLLLITRIGSLRFYKVYFVLLSQGSCSINLSCVCDTKTIMIKTINFFKYELTDIKLLVSQ